MAETVAKRGTRGTSPFSSIRITRLKLILCGTFSALHVHRSGGSAPGRLAAVSRQFPPDGRCDGRQSRQTSNCYGRTRPATPSSLRPPSPTASSMSASAMAILFRVDLATGKLRWKYSTKNFIGESSPAVGAGAVYIGDLDGTAACRQCARRQAAVDVQDGRRDQVVTDPVVSDLVLIGSYDTHLYALEARTGKLRWKMSDRRAGARDTCRRRRSGFHRRMRRDLPRDSHRRRHSRRTKSMSGAYTGRIAGARWRSRVLRDIQLRGDGARPERPQRFSGATAIPTQNSPTTRLPPARTAALSSAAATKWCMPSTQPPAKRAWTFATRARVDSSPAVAGDRVYVGSSDGRLYVLDLATGRSSGSSMPAPRSPLRRPSRRAASVIGSQDGVLYCFG